MKTSRELMKEIQEFKLWEAWFSVSPQGREAIHKLRQLKNGGNDLYDGNLISTVLSTCYIALNDSSENKAVDNQGRIAGIKYPKKLIPAKKRRKPTNVATLSLILHLSTLFRYYTSEESTFGWGGEKLPKFGQPCSDVVAAFVNAVFPQAKMDPSQVRNKALRLQKNGIKLAPWALS
jgi:hypothetical protein